MSLKISCELNKIYVLGSKGVGKTTLCTQLIGEKDFFTRSVVGIQTFKLIDSGYILYFKDLTDTSDFTYTKILEKEINEIKAIILIFSYDSKDSFINMKLLYDYIIDIKSFAAIPILIIGNKHDLAENTKLDDFSLDKLIKNDNGICFYNTILKDGEDIPKIKQFIYNNISYEDIGKETSQKSQSSEFNTCIIY